MDRYQARLIGFALLAISASQPATPALADSPVYADLNGACNGLTPCFLTIQEAVNNATDPDGVGPLFAEVFVFPGTYKESVNLSTMGGGAQGDLQMMTVDAEGALMAGTVFIDPPAGAAIASSANPEGADPPFAGALSLDGFAATSPDVDAVIVHITGDFVGRRLSTSFAGDDDGNTGETGLQVESEAGDITVEHCDATGNDGDGFFLVTRTGDVLVDDCTAIGNKDGIDVESAGNAMLTNCSATGGITRDSDSRIADGFELLAEGSLMLENIFAASNEDDGVEIVCGGDVMVINVTAEKSGEDGFDIILDGALTMERVTARTNGLAFEEGDGIDVDERTEDLGIPSVSILNAFVEGNRDNGLQLSDLVPGGKHRVHGSIICNNSDAGVEIRDTDATVDLRGNWWGDVTGPTHAKNATGLGDPILDATNGGAGAGEFDPWIDQITAVASHEKATLANNVTVQFQFRHGGSDTYLGEGPGAANGDRPFIVATDNGTVESPDGKAAAVSAFVGGSEGIVKVIAKAAVEGAAKIELVGPCFPARSVAVEIIPIPIPLPPNPTPAPGPAPETPFCGAGVPATAGLSAIGLMAMGLSTRPRRRLARP